MNLIERKAVQVAFYFLKRKMPHVKRYAPLIGSALLVASVVLRALGNMDAADAVDAIGKATGVSAQSPVSAVEFGAAAAALAGIVLKLSGEFRKAREAK